MQPLVRRFKALADGTRLRLLILLSLRPCCVCELASALGYTQPTITRHLQKLMEAGFLEVHRQGFFQIYYLSPRDEEASLWLQLVLESLRKTEEYQKLAQRLEEVERRPPLIFAPPEEGQSP